MGRDKARTDNRPGCDTAMNRPLRDGGQTIAYLRRDGKTPGIALTKEGDHRLSTPDGLQRIEELLGEFLPDCHLPLMMEPGHLSACRDYTA
jgi:hypothetical protein